MNDFKNGINAEFFIGRAMGDIFKGLSWLDGSINHIADWDEGQRKRYLSELNEIRDAAQLAIIKMHDLSNIAKKNAR